MDYTTIPAEASYELINDLDIDADEQLNGIAKWSKSVQVLRCSQCDRLWVFWQGMSEAPTEYLSQGVDIRPP
jgi:hypothetical protein